MPRPSSQQTPEQIAEERIREAAQNQSQALNLIALRLKQLPTSISQLTDLQELSLNNNQLTTVPEVIGQLTHLQELSLDGNQLATLPKNLYQLRRLKQLFLHDNPALGLPLEVLGPTWQENKRPAKPTTILDYYFRTRQAQRPLNEVKLLLVGRGGAGKTSLVRQLRENTFSARQRETSGITIKPWQLTCGQDLVQVHVWDFAGQVITHATHQFFLTQRSVYILVLTGREDSQKADAEYWLRLIRAFGTDRNTGETSPVIVVLNKWDSYPFRVDRNALQEKYPFIVNFVETDCKTGMGIDRLKALLAETVDHMDNVRSPFPSAWWAIKDQLERTRKDYLSYGEYRALCIQLGEHDESAQDSLAAVLHALGVALNYAEDTRLREATILNPHWVTNGIYTLLREAARGDGTGEMDLEDVARVLPKEKPDMQRYLVELMRRFDLAFPLTEDGERWLVPQRLPDEQPKLSAEWQSPDATRSRYRYTALPEGLLPRFITRTYPLSEEQPRWVNGVVLEADGARALIRADPAERLVTAVVHGEPTARRQLVSVIRADLSARRCRGSNRGVGHS
jgi:internalin A